MECPVYLPNGSRNYPYHKEGGCIVLIRSEEIY